MDILRRFDLTISEFNHGQAKFQKPKQYIKSSLPLETERPVRHGTVIGWQPYLESRDGPFSILAATAKA
jgi:hypothetical protein